MFLEWKELKLTLLFYNHKHGVIMLDYVTVIMATFPGRPFDPRILLNNSVSNVICVLVFGNRFEYSDNNFQSLLKNINEALYLEGSFSVQVNIFSILA